MKISIALATYNGATYLDEQLASYRRQTRPPDEVVISDDNSSDGTWGILEKFKAESPFPVRISRNPGPRGVFWNFRLAVKACKGDILVLSDQDDIWFPEKLFLIEKYLCSNPRVLALATNSEQISADGSARHINTWRDVCRFTERRLRQWQDDPVRIFLAYRGICSAHGLAVRGELKNLCGDLSDPACYAAVFPGFDSLLFATAAILKSAHWLYRPLTAYRRHGANTSSFERRNNIIVAAHEKTDRYCNRIRQVELAIQNLEEKGVVIDGQYFQRIREMVTHYEKAAAARQGGFRAILLLSYLALSGSYLRNAKPVRNLLGDFVCWARQTFKLKR